MSKKNKRLDEQSHGNNNHKGGSGNDQQTPGLARGLQDQPDEKVSGDSGNESERSKGTSGNNRQGGTGGAIRSGR
ncbi:hypothetical protein [Flaviaesturariibacter amylovorans]|uniref:Uncharacterized protein n=1 Tax=Flaviaesturariibacter amylovorans TaxID=1084520 RepID=A0ABP8G4Z8_9BACT